MIGFLFIVTKATIKYTSLFLIAVKLFYSYIPIRIGQFYP